MHGDNSSVDKAEKLMIQNRDANHNQSEQPEENRIQETEDSISSLWDNFKRSKILIIEVSEGEDKEKETGKLKKA